MINGSSLAQMVHSQPRGGNVSAKMRCACVSQTLSLLNRVIPHPISFFFVEHFLAVNTAVVRFIPAHRVENELAVLCAVIFTGLPSDQVVGHLGHEFRCQSVQSLWELS